ncbi:unnamed protein product [Nippostrongylus brasiliensis]|uniref:Uncharacterized protein n=1 Tax=Nippostrongylus brasiliensis TaxID=27835 RepID=A0A0N4YMY5_NIPBR|nr:unnamed protein product [Nippostrongylus brasiliensis]
MKEQSGQARRQDLVRADEVDARGGHRRSRRIQHHTGIFFLRITRELPFCGRMSASLHWFAPLLAERMSSLVIGPNVAYAFVPQAYMPQV